MAITNRTPWLRFVFVAMFVTIVLTSLIVGWIRTESLTAKLFVAGFFLFCGVLFTYSTINDWLQDRRLRRLLKDREVIDPETFGTRYFGDLSRGAEVAAAVRRLLDEHLEFNLGGLRPEDELDYLRDWIDPLFLDELTRRLAIEPPADWSEFLQFLEPLRTIRDLVEAMARKIPESARG
jgi:hypothetical protein